MYVTIYCLSAMFIGLIMYLTKMSFKVPADTEEKRQEKIRSAEVLSRRSMVIQVVAVFPVLNTIVAIVLFLLIAWSIISGFIHKPEQ